MGASSLDRCAATTTDEERRAAEEPLGRTAAAAAAGRLVNETVWSMTFAIGKERMRGIGIEKEERVMETKRRAKPQKKRTSNHNSKKKKNRKKKTRPSQPATMRPATATANAVATATKSISRTESLELVRCLLRVVSLFGRGGGRGGTEKKEDGPNARESVFIFFFLLPSTSVAPPASDHLHASEGTRGRTRKLKYEGKKAGRKGKTRGRVAVSSFFFFSPTATNDEKKKLSSSPSSTSRISAASSRTRSSSR